MKTSDGKAKRGRGRRVPQGATAVLATALIAASFGSCTLVVGPKEGQCGNDADCTGRGEGFAGTVCDQQRGVCVAPNGVSCTSNAQCVEANGGQPFTCRKSDRTCVSLTSAECPRVLGDPSDLADDNAIIIGTLLARTGVTAAGVAAMEDAIELARRDFKTATPGLPPATPNGGQRPLVFVNCDEADDALKATNHLLGLEVPAILGAYYSSSTIKVATTATINKNVLLITPASNSPLITSLPTNNPRLVWRMVPSDAIQSVVVPEVLKTVLEPQARALMQPTDQLRVAVVHRGDAAGVGIAGSVIPKLAFNGGKSASENGENFREIDYGDPLDKVNNPDPEVKYAEAAASLLEFEPHVAIAVGTTSEVVTKIFTPLETQWAQTAYRPRYLLANNTLQSQDTLNFMGTNAELRARVLGHVAGAAGGAIEQLRIRFDSTFDNAFTGLVPFAYDSVYLLAFGIVANGENPLTGPNLAASLAKLVAPEPKIDVGVSSISAAYGYLTHGNSIDLNGVSGPLNFNPATGEAEADVQIWCAGVDMASGAAKGYVNSGLFYSAAAGGLQGSISQCR
ncbi:MAG TPA: hypothetical protein VFS43_24980 [Polyangiaceae bacterium]|nr:hypothetical protein [Polyangiaceae bacterium]